MSEYLEISDKTFATNDQQKLGKQSESIAKTELVEILNSFIGKQFKKLRFKEVSGKCYVNFYAEKLTEPHFEDPGYELKHSSYTNVSRFLTNSCHNWTGIADINSQDQKHSFAFLPRAKSGGLFKVSDETFLSAGSPMLTLELCAPLTKENLYLFLNVSKNQADTLSELSKKSSGLIFANCSKHKLEISGETVLATISPFVTLYKDLLSQETARKLVQKSVTELVVIAHNSPDTLSPIADFYKTLGDDNDMKNAFLKNICGSFIHYRARKICKNCAKLTPVSPQTTEKIHPALRLSNDHSYIFGRGCSVCNQTCYHGEVGLTSTIHFGEEFKAMREFNLHTLAKHFHEQGHTSILEDGLKKIEAHITSYEEVLKLQGSLPTYLANVIVKQTGPDFFTAESDEGMKIEVKDKNILIIEDDREQLHVLSAIFKTEGYNVLTATNGKEGCNTLDRNEVDLVICDLMMPVMNGAQFVKQVRSNPKKEETPILMLTAVADSDAEVALLAHGADDYIQKTVRKKILLKRVQKLIERNSL